MSLAIGRVFAFLLLMVLAPPLFAQQYYKWVDDEGVTHYASEKPKGKDARKVEAHNPPSSSQDQAMERLQEQRKEAEQQRQAAQESQEQEEREKENPQAVNKENCEQHRKNLETLNKRSVVRRKNPETGEQETLTDEERQAMIEKTKKALERCNDNNSN